MRVNQDRRSQIVDLINKNRTVTNAELMERFGISIETVRRDLRYLEEEGCLERVYGGAVKKAFLGAEPLYASREMENHAEKSAIAAEAEKLIQQDDAVFFDLGTTVLLLAKQLNREKKLTAFTNALRTAIALTEDPNADVLLLGGQLRPHELTVSGRYAEEFMQNFNVDKAFIGFAGITEDGITDFHVTEADLRRMVIRNARQVIAMSDSSKFGIRTMNNICALKDIDILITDDKAPVDLLRKIEKAGVRVILVKP